MPEPILLVVTVTPYALGCADVCLLLIGVLIPLTLAIDGMEPSPVVPCGRDRAPQAATAHIFRKVKV